MPTPPLPFSEIKHTVDVWHAVLDEGWPARGSSGQAGALSIAAIRVRLNNSGAFASRLDTAAALGVPVREWRVISPTFQEVTLRRYRQYDADFKRAEAMFAPADHPGDKIRIRHDIILTNQSEIRPGGPPRPGRSGRRVEVAPDPPTGLHPPSGQVPFQDEVRVAPLDPRTLVDKIAPLLRGKPLNLGGIADRLGVDPTVALQVIGLAHARGLTVVERGGLWHLDMAPAMGHQRGVNVPTLTTDKDGVLRFATVGDTHLCSKYAREDCLADFYDNVAHRGLKHVLHAGNWIDGEAVFNRHDLIVHGMDAQMQYLARNYPRRAGVETWAITGEDHEGWYSRREGIDVGRYAENVMRQNDRTDWHDMGFMENFIDLVHGATGKSCKLLLMHPGGGSSYATSYAPQKIVEGFDGGDKPAVLVLGHYHKASYNLIRNVHVVQTGCFEDQTVFMRKQKLAAHLAGCFIELTLDPETGAVVEFTTTFRNYFVRDYYRGRWSQHGPVNHAPRSAA